MREQTALLRQQAELLEGARDAIILRDFESGLIEYWNQGATKIYGYDQAEAEGRIVHDLLKTKFPKPLKQILDELADTGSWEGELMHVRKDGSLIVVESRNVLLRDDDGRPRALLMINRDVTRRRRAEERLRENEQRYRVIYDRSPIGICRVALDGTLLDMNEALEAFLEIVPRGAIIGRNLSEITHPDDLAAKTALYGELESGLRDRFQLENRYLTGAGQVAWGNLTVSSVRDTEGRTLYYVAMVEDIRERKHAEQELTAALRAAKVANEQLERVNKEKSMFVAIVSHEFRTALTGILGFSELMREEELGVAEMKEFASDIEKDAQRLKRMINELLDLERMESGQMTLRLDHVDVNGLLRQEAAKIVGSSPAHRLEMDLDPDLPAVLCDGDKITQVLSNLLSNAVKYSPEGGAIEIHSHADGNLVHATVRDHGLGMPAEALRRVFQRYARIESSATRYIKGTGLGLAIVSQIVGMHGGRVWVESELGRGSVFHVELRASGPEDSL